METALLIAQLVATLSITAWLTTGVRDNLLHPSINETYTAEVMEMARLRIEYPDAFAAVAHRAIESRKVQKRAFRAIVVIEIVAATILWVGSAALLLALLGSVSAETARATAMIGATAFIAIWAAFLVVGNHFSYWFCHEGAQNTHYQMTLWGLATLILLAQG